MSDAIRDVLEGVWRVGGNMPYSEPTKGARWECKKILEFDRVEMNDS